MTQILQASHISKWYGDEKTKKNILTDVNFTIEEGELVAILGPSGSGKSTFLRILAGLIPASTGDVFLDGKKLVGINQNTAIVFQNFALYPWLTVEKNVEIGLIASTISENEKKERIVNAVRVIGLQGFENAYPKEISGGMKQRVGFARALVVQPEILMMDEPFSALDVLTAENLRHELLSLWLEKKIPTKAILMVTHNIDEAVSMADRLFVLSTNPGQIRIEIPGLSVEKRRTKTPERLQLVDTIYQIMTNPKRDALKLLQGVHEFMIPSVQSPYQVLPQVHVSDMKAFLRKILESGEDQPKILEHDFSLDTILPLTEIIGILGFGGIEGNKVVLSELGKLFATATPDQAKQIMRIQLLANVSLVQYIAKQIEQSIDRVAKVRDIMKYLRQYFIEIDAEQQFRSALILALYAGIFKINRRTEEIRPILETSQTAK
jgi:NitT/TauT family transport system ATP-binding protein